jgi:azurin
MSLRILVGLVGVGVGVVMAGAGAAGQSASKSPARLVVLTVTDPVGEKMSYSLSEIVAKPGERLRVQVISMGKLPKSAMAHNFVLLKLGSNPKKFSDDAANARVTDVFPPAFQKYVLASTEMVGPGERSETTFTVPKVPGRYPYLCTFAGHYAAGMAGTLVVK